MADRFGMKFAAQTRSIAEDIDVHKRASTRWLSSTQDADRSLKHPWINQYFSKHAEDAILMQLMDASLAAGCRLNHGQP